eukprot:6789976-Pyramimonas_sp.AAC.1
MPRTQQQLDALLERMRTFGRIAERTSGSIGGAFSRGHRAGVFRGGTLAEQPAGRAWNGDPPPSEAATPLSQQGGQ